MSTRTIPAAVVSWALQIPISKDNEPAWTQLEGSRLGDRQRVALRLVAAGIRPAAAAEAAGLADDADLYRYLRRFGFEPPDRATLGQEFRRIAGMCAYEWQRRLEDAPEKIPTNLLQVGAGISTDKVAKAEGWETKQGDAADDKAAAFIRRLEQVVRGRISLDVEDGRADEARRIGPGERSP